MTGTYFILIWTEKSKQQDRDTVLVYRTRFDVKNIMLSTYTKELHPSADCLFDIFDNLIFELIQVTLFDQYKLWTDRRYTNRRASQQYHYLRWSILL